LEIAKRLNTCSQSVVPFLRIELDAQRPLLLAVETIEDLRQLLPILFEIRRQRFLGAEERERTQGDDGSVAHQVRDNGLMAIADRSEPFEISGAAIDRLLRKRLARDRCKDR
jgi:hypothetical protein